MRAHWIAAMAVIALARGLVVAQAFLPVFPIGVVPDADGLIVRRVDLNPAPGATLAWDCSALTSDGHAGTDIEIRSFAQQAIGVPVFAAADGVVLQAHDTEPDMNTQALGQPSNFVLIDHGGVRTTRYDHLRMGSVSVSVGQQVRAGQQIGLVGSSGSSAWPHLHFEVRAQPGDGVVEPWSGPCRPGASGWKDQPSESSSLRVLDFGVTAANLGAMPPPPHGWPASGHLAMMEQPHWVWMLVSNLPANSTLRVRWLRPSGTLGLQTGVMPLGNGSPLRRLAWRVQGSVEEMVHTAGTWRVQVEINGSLAIVAPIEVLPGPDPSFNRAPAPITAELVGGPIGAGDPVVCRVTTAGALDDPDFDVVRFTYTWSVDGVPVREATHAGQADALAAGIVEAGRSVACAVAVSDGALTRAPVVASAIVDAGAAPCPGDADGDGLVDFNDITAILSDWLNSYAPATGPGDANSDGVVDFNDITEVLSRWLDPC